MVEKRRIPYTKSVSIHSFNTNSSPGCHPTDCQVEMSPTAQRKRSFAASKSVSFDSSTGTTTTTTIRALRAQPIYFIFAVFAIVWLYGISISVHRFQSSPNRVNFWLPDETTSTSTSQSNGLRARVMGPPLMRGSSSVSIPLPLPKEKVTVILMNFSRPRMIRESTMMRTLLQHPNVDEVLLLHSNPDTVFEFVHPKVVNIDAIDHNKEMGLSLRFYFCQMAKNPWVMHLDDDMEFTAEVLNELFIEYSRNPRRIVGRFGRDLTPGNSFNGYNSKSRHKSTEVVLTKLMVMERDTCAAFFEYAHLIWNDVVLHEGEGPLWNGEDIFMSLVANHIYGETEDGRKFHNYAMDWLNVWQADDSLKDYSNGKLDISGGMKGYAIWDWRWWQTVLRRNRHYSYRGMLWQTARNRLQELH
jgi:hypothetical protein